MSLSNDQSIASENNWVLGYLPEEQIDLLISYMLDRNKSRLSIISSEDSFGKRILEYLKRKEVEGRFNLIKEKLIQDNELTNEEYLNSQIKSFTNFTISS